MTCQTVLSLKESVFCLTKTAVPAIAAVFLTVIALSAADGGEEGTALKCLKDEVLTYEVKLKQNMWAHSQAEHFLLTATVDVICVADGLLPKFGTRGMKFRMHIHDFNVVIEDEEDGIEEDEEDDESPDLLKSNLNKKFENPFYFIQLENGTMAYVLHQGDDDSEVLNIKKAIASLFQVALNKGENDVEETGANSKHKAHYRVEGGEGGELKVHKQYSSADVERFSAGSNVDPSDVDYDEDEDIVVSDGTPTKITGKLHTALFNKPETEDDEEDDEESFQKASDLDDDLTADQEYSVTLVRRQKSTRKRSVVMVRVEDTHGLQISSIESVHKEVDVIESQRDSLRHQVPLFIEQLREIVKADGDYNESYNKLLYMMELEGLCEYHRCSSGVETPVSGMVAHFFETTESSNLRHFLFPLLVTSGSKVSQTIIEKVLENPDRYGLDVKFVLSSISFINKPSEKLIFLVKETLQSNEEASNEGLLALGAMAQNADSRTSDEITEILLKRLAISLKLADSSEDSSFSKAAAILFAIGNTQNIKAVEPLLDVIQSDSVHEKVKLAAVLILNQLADVNEARVDDLLLERLGQEPENGTNTIALAILHLLSDRLWDKSKQKLKICQLEAAIAARLTNSKGSALATLYGDYTEAKTSRRTRRATSYDWANTNGQFNDIASLSSRRYDKSRYPSHIAYMYGKRLGVDKLHIRFTAGAFAGSNLRGNSALVKVFGKAVGIAHAFKKDYKILNSYVIVTGTGSSVRYSVYAKLGSRTIIPYTSRSFKTCYFRTVPVGKGPYYRVFNVQYRLPLVLGLTIRFYLSGSIKLGGVAGFRLCPLQSTIASAYFRPYITFSATGGADASIVLVRGGLRVSANLNYYLKPVAQLTRRGKTFSVCLNIYHGNNANSVTIGFYYQTRKITWKSWKSKGWFIKRWIKRPVISWSGRKTIGGLSRTLRIGSSGERKLWGKCGSRTIG